MAKKSGGLGQGLDALFYENFEQDKSETTLRITEIEPNRDQPRKEFSEAAIAELSESIKQHGLIQPILVRPMDNGRYQIVAGERRWRASRLAGLDRVPVVIRELDDMKAMEIALIENLQREDLNAVEEAKGYKALIDKFGLTQDDVALKVNKSRPAITNALRLLNLTDEELEALSAGKITAGHARALLSLEGETRKLGFSMALAGATVREIERLGRDNTKPAKKQKEKNKLYKEVEIAIATELGRKVTVSGNGKNGILHIEFFSDEDLCELAKKLGK